MRTRDRRRTDSSEKLADVLKRESQRASHSVGGLVGRVSMVGFRIYPAFDNWIAGKGYKFAKEIAEMANNMDLLQQLKVLGV